MITLIAAVDESMGIGRHGTLPWYIPADLKLFSQETMGGALIMGRKTWESLGCKPLKHRLNFVVSSTLDPMEHWDNAITVPSLAQAVEQATALRTRVYGIGGTAIFEGLLPLARRMVLTRIPGRHACDTFFPKFNPYFWVKKDRNIYGLNIDEYLKKD